MLKQLILQKRMAGLKSQIEALRVKDEEFTKRSEGLKTREAELETAVNELTDESTEEEKTVVEEAVAVYEADEKALVADQEANEAAKGKLEGEIQTLQAELDEIDSRAKTPPAENHKTEERKDDKSMNTRVKFFTGMTIEERSALISREDVKEFLSRTRNFVGQKRAVSGAELTIPEVLLETLRDRLTRYSKLIKYVNVRPVKGKARQNISGAVPEGVWTEACANLNELEISFAQIEVDGYKVGGFIPVCNATLEDSDENLAAEIMDALGQAIGYAIDRAILFGTGTKMPLGIVTRLAQTSAPADWNTNAPTWTDLHTSNIKKININGTTGATFYASLIAELGIAKPNYSDGVCFWVMNRATHIEIMAKALAFDAAAALVAGVHNQFPIVGGDIVELEMVADHEIIGGFGSLYLLAERAGAQIAQSEHVRFIEDQTVFKGTARYDGMPVFGEGFVQVNYANADAAASSTFPADINNPTLGALTITSTAHASTAGSSDITMTGGQADGTFFGYKVGAKAANVEYGTYHTGFTPVTFTVGAATLADFADADDGKILTVVEFYYGIAIAAGSKALKIKKTV